MADLSSYANDTSLVGTEKVLSTDTDGTTKNILLSDLKTYVNDGNIEQSDLDSLNSSIQTDLNNQYNNITSEYESYTDQSVGDVSQTLYDRTITSYNVAGSATIDLSLYNNKKVVFNTVSVGNTITLDWSSVGSTFETELFFIDSTFNVGAVTIVDSATNIGTLFLVHSGYTTSSADIEATGDCLKIRLIKNSAGTIIDCPQAQEI